MPQKNGSTPITILIVDDHTLIRESWCFILGTDPRYKVISQCADGECAIDKAAQFHPDVILLDINMPKLNGLQALPILRKKSPQSKIIGVSLYKQPVYARKMLKDGAMGYLTKNSGKDEMLEAIAAVHSGKKFICQEIKNILSELMLNEDDDGINKLSERELEIIALIKKGLSSKEIAAQIFLSVKTVEVHRYNIHRKLGLRNSAELINFINQKEVGLEY